MQKTEVVAGLVGHEAAQGAQVGAEGQLARGLDAGEDAGPMGGDGRAGGPWSTHMVPGNHTGVINLVPMPYDVTTPVFEGPFDLLLHLILREQVELYDVSLTKIVDAYLAELESMEKLSLDVATEFLLIAATLIELKTRRLLPGDDDLDLDDELALWDERDLLLTRLVECKTFKDAAVALARAVRRRRPLVPAAWPGPTSGSSTSRPTCSRASPPTTCAPRSCGRSPRSRSCASTSTTSRRSARRSPTRSSSCSRSCPLAGTITFRELTGALVERLEVVVRFLAVLELFKQGFVDLDQPRTFGDIQIVWLGPRPLRARGAVAGRCLRWLT